MSQGRIDFRQEATEAEKRATLALNQMIASGRSWSGRERNCFFLNTRGQGFTDISAASGLDFPDDARAVALTDWDHDGDIDLWISNRNAPRLRFMRNESPHGNRYSAIKLRGNGTTTNRDAVGARVEVVTDKEGDKRRIKTLHAGDGFLAQSTKWLHFGLGDSSSIQKVIVVWPGGELEEFAPLEVDHRYALNQGTGRPFEITDPSRALEIFSSVPETPTPSHRRGIPLLAPVPITDLLTMPELAHGKTVLLNLWASWCPPCVAELGEFTEREREIREAGLSIVALSVDGIGDDGSSPDKAARLLTQQHFPFPSYQASSELLHILQFVHDLVIPLHRPLPLPTSFLIDSRGSVSVIYKGRMAVDDLLEDAAHSRAAPVDRLRQAAHFSGSTLDDARLAEIVRVKDAKVRYQIAKFLDEAGRVDEASRYYQSVLDVAPSFTQALLELSKLSERRGQFRDAVQYYRQAIHQDPNSLDAANNLAWLLATCEDSSLRDGEEAVRWARHCVDSTGGKRSSFLDTLAAALAENGDFTQAVRRETEAIELAPDEKKAAYQSRRTLYESGVPYRQPSQTPR